MNKEELARLPGLHTAMAGRGFEEQARHISETACHRQIPLLRQGILRALGSTMANKRAENVVIFGCHIPFDFPWHLRSYLQLMERLGIEFTYLEKEYCCGMPLILGYPDRERETGSASEEFNLRNLQQARELGARNMVYFCVWCAHLGKRFLSEQGVNQLYYPDVILDRLEPEPMRWRKSVAYFEGCHSVNQIIAPGVELRRWGQYRRLLGHIQGLKVTDLSTEICCWDDPAYIVQQAVDAGLDTLVCACTQCSFNLQRAAQDKVKIELLPDLLLRVLGSTRRRAKPRSAVAT